MTRAPADADADAHDPRFARTASGLLGEFNAAGVLTTADVHVANRLGRLGAEPDERVLLAVALTVRAIRHGSVCIDLDAISHTVLGESDELIDVSALAWPDPAAWRAACACSPLVGTGRDAGSAPLRMPGRLLYLDRYWRQEEQVRTQLRDRAAAAPPAVDLDRLRAGLDRLFPGDPAGAATGTDRQRLAAAVAALRRVTVLAGGPGTGKTTTVARLLALLRDQPGPPPRIALAAPTGKAAARLAEAVAEHTAELPEPDRAGLGPLPASTLHRLLGRRPGSTSRFAHDRYHRLPHDVIVVDETSMVSLTLMARLLEAVRPDARLVLVGDPDQLASVEAGAVLGDLARADGQPEPWLDERLRALGALGPADPPVVHGVVTLDRTWRFGGAIAALARAVQAGDADAALTHLRAGHPELMFVETDDLDSRDPAGLESVRADVVAATGALSVAARDGAVADALAALERHRLLCGHRRGPYGVSRWSAEVERWLADAGAGSAADDEWYPGRPLLVTANDYDLGLFNGDTGVVVRENGAVRAAFTREGRPLRVPTSRLSAVQTVHAMTVHRSQGSQFSRVTVVLPPAESPLLTRELLYTAVTRAREVVRVVGSEQAVRTAVGRSVSRASGLRERLGH
ncbi:exodeoxyribonuclease V subunit alpha [Pseudonocardia asaccharolytica]|uniref:RecBCD enzyme subunit RecD n=1 Tax=Pseudonocardia asaccharolytica DSM 44247 = NBRC 16224 TaxID=1123024 RepID=A0A511CYB6_9PSEU|nr:exodeoxyribonuclease V subunit alpha [Pseudonocardia asaccharolytica]GEL17559.1 RecBCD enzyme subunit RecD [Pseudonocardia asaccharolytica DSM 44247 = NBRC 16224]